MVWGRNNGGKRLTILTKLTIIALCYFFYLFFFFTFIKHEDNNKEISSELSGLSANINWSPG